MRAAPMRPAASMNSGPVQKATLMRAVPAAIAMSSSASMSISNGQQKKNALRATGGYRTQRGGGRNLMMASNVSAGYYYP